MADEAFDAATRRVGADASRRGLLRIGIGALTAVALSGRGLSAADDAQAKQRRRSRKNQSSCKRDR